MVTDKFARF